jgi:hypothetical protein
MLRSVDIPPHIPEVEEEETDDEVTNTIKATTSVTDFQVTGIITFLQHHFQHKSSII